MMQIIDKQLKLLILSISFGFWQNSVFAGIFMYFFTVTTLASK